MGCGVSQLIRWQHTGWRLLVLWYDGAAECTQRTEVDAITLERLDGEPLAHEVAQTLTRDLCAHVYYQGVAC